MPRILAGASCRRLPHVLEAHLKTLKWQQLPDDFTLDLCHIDDLDEGAEDARKLLTDAGSTVLSGVEKVDIVDFSDASETTHAWQLSAFERVARNKQMIFDKAVAEGYDYVWIVDTDLILDPLTLMSMITAEKPIVAAVYWTRWQPNTPAAPQVWLNHPYELQGRGLTFEEFRRKLTSRNLTQVYGLGACMLVNTAVLTKTRYYPLVPELVAAGGMMAGEDRTFCLLAELNHVEMYADPWPDIFHVYRPSDEADIGAYIAEFERNERYGALFPAVGDLVSLRLVPLEDPNVGTQCVRGRLGELRLLPELESAVLSMRRSERRILPVSFPVDYELAATGAPAQQVVYRGQRKMIEVMLIDHKPLTFPPTLREDIVREEESFNPKDMYLYDGTLLQQLRAARPA